MDNGPRSRCIDCGLLSWVPSSNFTEVGQAVPPEVRAWFRVGATIPPRNPPQGNRPGMFVCMLRREEFGDNIDGNLAANAPKDVAARLAREHGCKDWLRHVPDLLPKEHLMQRQLEASTSPTQDAPLLDDLLPLYRRAAFNDALPLTVESSTGSGTPLALIMIDLDHFKRVNDEHGHQAGDEVLRAAGDVVRACVDSKGRGDRYGGEEIAVLLPNYTADEATVLAERIRKQIEAATIGPKQLRVTASLGIACLPDHATDAPTLVTKADGAMYEAKNLGRNCVRVSGEPRPSQPSVRQITRREPEPGVLTEDEMRAIRTEYFQRRQALCPRDQAILVVHELRGMGATPWVSLLISCPLCGLQATAE